MSQNPEVLKTIGNKYEVYPISPNTPYDGKTAVCIDVLYDEGLSMDVYVLDKFDKSNKYLGMDVIYSKIPANYKRTTSGIFSPIKVGNNYTFKPDYDTRYLRSKITVKYVSPNLVTDGTLSVLCWEEVEFKDGYKSSSYRVWSDSRMREIMFDHLETM